MSRENNAYGAVPGLPAFSIVVTCYNLEKYIREALDSCCKQDYDGEWEVIVVDDCSTDNSRDIIRSYMAEHPEAPMRFLPREQNGGVAAATDTAVAAAKYDWIVMADGDDVQLPERLSKAAITIQKHPDIKFLTMSRNSMSADGTITGQQYYLVAADSNTLPPNELCKTSPEERMANMQAKHDKLANTGASGLFHRDCYTRFGTLQGKSPHHLEQDPILMFRAMLLGPVMGTRDLACNYRNHATNLTNITLPGGVRGVMAFERHQDKYLILHTRTLHAELRDLEHAISHPDITDWPPDLLDRARQHLLQEIAFCGTRAEWWKSSWWSRIARAKRAGQLKSMVPRLLPFPIFCFLQYWRKR